MTHVYDHQLQSIPVSLFFASAVSYPERAKQLHTNKTLVTLVGVPSMINQHQHQHQREARGERKLLAEEVFGETSRKNIGFLDCQWEPLWQGGINQQLGLLFMFFFPHPVLIGIQDGKWEKNPWKQTTPICTLFITPFNIYCIDKAFVRRDDQAMILIAPHQTVLLQATQLQAVADWLGFFFVGFPFFLVLPFVALQSAFNFRFQTKIN